MKPYRITIRQHGSAPRTLDAIAESSADAILGVMSELPPGAFITCAPALPAFHEITLPRCCRLDGCDMEPRCSDVCDAETWHDPEANAEAKAARREWSHRMSHPEDFV